MWNQYFLPECLEDAHALLARFSENARLAAGGTDMILALSEGRLPPTEALIDISRISELKTILHSGDRLEIGAGVVLSDLIKSDEVRQYAPILVEAAKQIAGPQIRNLATVGGNVVNASPAADMIPPLLVLNAVVCTKQINGKLREIPITQFVKGNRKVDLLPGEIVTSFYFAIPETGSQQLFRKVQPRRAMAIAILNLAIVAKVENGRFREIHIAMGAVAPTAVRLINLESKLKGLDVRLACHREIFIDTDNEISPISDFRASEQYRRHVARRLLQEQIVAISDMS